MPCLLGCMALSLPRVVLLLVFLFSNYLGRAYETNLWPVLGFLFMPLTTLAYAYAFNENQGQITGFYLGVVITAVIVDLGIFGTSRRRRRDPREPRAPDEPSARGPSIDVKGERVG